MEVDPTKNEVDQGDNVTMTTTTTPENDTTTKVIEDKAPEKVAVVVPDLQKSASPKKIANEEKTVEEGTSVVVNKVGEEVEAKRTFLNPEEEQIV